VTHFKNYCWVSQKKIVESRSSSSYYPVYICLCFCICLMLRYNASKDLYYARRLSLHTYSITITAVFLRDADWDEPHGDGVRPWECRILSDGVGMAMVSNTLSFLGHHAEILMLSYTFSVKKFDLFFDLQRIFLMFRILSLRVLAL